jgi:hypothetical protein
MCWIISPWEYTISLTKKICIDSIDDIIEYEILTKESI